MSAAVAASLASGGVESVNFLNDIIGQLWDNINIAGGNLTKEIVEPMFAEMLPGPLSSLHFTKIDLGKKPIKLDRIDVQERSEDVIKLDVDVFWDGECDIELSAKYIGTFGISKLKLGGRMSVLLTPVINRLPLVTALQVSFVNPPKLDIDYTGLAEIAEFGLIDQTIAKIINKIIASLLVLPSRLLIKIDPANVWFNTYQMPLGYLRLCVESGQGFVVPKGWIKDVPDVYCKVHFGADPEWRTKAVSDSVCPEWMQSKDFLLSDHDQFISLEALDSDTLGGDDALGKGRITVGQLLLAGQKSDMQLKAKHQETGAKISLKCAVMQFTSNLESFSAEEHAAEDLQVGMLTILIAGVTDLPVVKTEAGSSVKVSAFGETFQTAAVFNNPGIDALNPSYDAAFRVPLTSTMVQNPSDVLLTLMNKKKTMGAVTIAFADVMKAEKSMVTDEYKLDNGAVIKARVMLHGIEHAAH